MTCANSEKAAAISSIREWAAHQKEISVPHRASSRASAVEYSSPPPRDPELVLTNKTRMGKVPPTQRSGTLKHDVANNFSESISVQ
jgi:hypothetical protein